MNWRSLRYFLFAVLSFGFSRHAAGGEVYFYASIIYDHPNQTLTGYAGTVVDYWTEYYYGGVLAPGDTCFFLGSEIPRVTGFPNPTTWRVGYIQNEPAGDKDYGLDGVGWKLDEYIYYQASRAPCGVSMMQAMEMSCGFDWWRHYTSHELHWGINIDVAISGKDGLWENIYVP